MRSWLIALALTAALAVVAVMMAGAWTRIEVTLPWPAVAAMIAGVVLSLAVGFGLMALVFYSSRSGHDEEAARNNHLPRLRRDRDRDRDEPGP